MWSDDAFQVVCCTPLVFQGQGCLSAITMPGTFVSKYIDEMIDKLTARMREKDPVIADMFGNCLPNTLDTTVLFHGGDPDGLPDTFIIIGDTGVSKN